MKQTYYIENDFGLTDTNQIKAKTKIDMYHYSQSLKLYAAYHIPFNSIILYELVLTEDKKDIILTYELNANDVIKQCKEHPFMFTAKDIAPIGSQETWLQIELFVLIDRVIFYPKVEAVI